MVDWSQPIELVDGTPVVLSDLSPQPDEDGHYRVEHEHGDGFFDHVEEWGGNTRIFVAADGRWWLAEDGDAIVRNREVSQ